MSKSFAVFVLTHLMLLAGCAGTSGDTAVKREEPGAPTGDYLIGPGDALRVFVWRHEDLSADVQVRPDGMISTPLVEDMKAAGKRPSELARDLELALSEYVRSPTVTVIVQTFVGDTQQQIRVVGQAAQPQALQYRKGMTLLDVMIEVGGLSETASGNRAKIVRRVGNEQVEIPVELNDLLNKGKIEENIAMQPGDVLIIPESIF